MGKSRNKLGNIFYASDHHLGHASTFEKFKNPDGTSLRPFTSVDEMNQKIIDNHNSVVSDIDTVYFLGDCVINKKYLELFKQMNGRKVLILGNHDQEPIQKFLDVGIARVHAYRVFVDEFVCSHMPIHPESISERFIANVHGHLHGNRVMRDETYMYDYGAGMMAPATRRVLDHRYFSVCVEQINYTPIAHEDVKTAINKQFEDAGVDIKAKKGWGNGSQPS